MIRVAEQPTLGHIETRAVQDGTRQNYICSNRGQCTTSTAICKCDAPFQHFDGLDWTEDGNCGHLPTNSLSKVACPKSVLGKRCNGHGRCTDTYTCSCDLGWSGHACEKRNCPEGHAWFDKATAANSAHGLTECSNQGSCNYNTGTCKCRRGFEGPACELMSCPKNSNGICSGHGTCVTIGQLADDLQRKNRNSNVTISYGSQSFNVSTWDSSMVQGCNCHSEDIYLNSTFKIIRKWHGYDCSLRTCVKSLPKSGTKALECSGHGICDTKYGVCKCFDNYYSSNGNGTKGERNDCGLWYGG